MNILVTGGLGFIGSHLVDRLLEERHQVTIVDNKLSNVVDPSYYSERGCTVVVCDVADFQPEQSYERIYHLASVVGPAGVLPHSGNLGGSTIRCTLRVLEMCEEMQARLLYVSTSEVYGRDGTFDEETFKVVPTKISARLEYAVSKLLGEIIAVNRSRVNGIQSNIVRPFNVVGPRQASTGGFVLPRFFEAAFAGRPITVFGDGSQVRSFTHVRDVVEAMVMAMSCELTGQIFNIGNPENTVTIRELALLVKKTTGSGSEIAYVNPKDIYGPLYEEAFDKIPNPAKIRSLLGWQPKYDLAKILDELKGHYSMDRDSRGACGR